MDKVRRIFQPPEESYFLFGPRGTGKSTFLRQQYPEALVLDLLSPDTYRLFSSRPERLREYVMANPNRKTVVVDEIQKVPELLDVVHLLLERGKERQFILTGSSSRKLKRTGVDLLAGRALYRTLHPFMAVEIGSLFDVGEALNLGMVPLIRAAADPVESLKAYAALYLKEEVQAEGFVRNIGHFARFLEILSFSHGSLLNIADIARECQVGYKAAQGFVEIVEDMLLGFRLPVFTKRARRHVIQHPKFYFFDAGVYRSLRPTGPLDRPEEISGGSLEGLVFQHLKAWLGYRNRDETLSFWRTKSGVEVDFIVYGEGVFMAIEVKRSALVYRKDTAGVRAFLADYPEAKGLVVYGGHERLIVAGIPCIPCDEFLLSLHPDKMPIS